METPRYWRLNKQKYRLIGEVCPHCEEKIFPPRDICTGIGCGKNTFTLPLTSRAERRYYSEKGVILKESTKSTRVNLKELFNT